VQMSDLEMAGGEETNSLLDRKLNNSSTQPPPSYSMFQSMSSPAFNRSAFTQRCSPVANVAVVRAPLLDDRVVSAVIRSVPPLERAVSVPDSHDSYVSVAVANDDQDRNGRPGCFRGRSVAWIVLWGRTGRPRERLKESS